MKYRLWVMIGMGGRGREWVEMVEEEGVDRDGMEGEEEEEQDG